MAINLVTKYQSKLANLYTTHSFLKGKTSTEWEWDGSRNIKILSIVTQALNNYDRTASGNRYGTPAELQDTVQTLSVTQDKSFSIVIDKGNLTQQLMLKKAGQVLSAEVSEKVVPAIDTYALAQFAKFAGKVVDAGAAITKDNIIAKLVGIEDHFADSLIPTEGRYVFVKNPTVSLFRQSLMSLDNITDRLLLKGVVGKFGTLNIVGIPSSWMPADVEALAFQTKSVVLPEQISDAKIHEDPQGFSGNVLEGRYLFDAGVVGAFADGVYALMANGKKSSALTVSVAGALTSVSGHTYLYTNDGTDPRYSDTAIAVTAAGASTSLTHTSGDTLKVVETTTGKGWSDVASVVTTS